jgi:hypothetical protein
MQDVSNGYGKITTLNMKDFNYIHSNYRDISGNYNVMFHNDVKEIKKQNDMYDLSFGEVRVRDQNGNIIILPRVDTNESVTYYQPGEFQFGASTYIPNYEDSVYLSRITDKKMFGVSRPRQCDDACKAYNEFKTKMGAGARTSGGGGGLGAPDMAKVRPQVARPSKSVRARIIIC